MRLGLAIGLLLPAVATAQDSRPAEAASVALAFGWRAGDEATVTSTSRRADRSFALRYRVVVEDAGDGALRVGRREVRVVEWNGAVVTPGQRARLRPLELQVETTPDVLVDATGALVGVEAGDAWRTRVEGLIDRALEAGEIDRATARGLADVTGDETRRVGLDHQAKQGWDDWVGRWLIVRFDESNAPFTGEIELATGDVVDGEFVASVGETGPDDLARLRIDFKAAGSRLDAAALRWRQKLFGGGDEAFERVAMAVEETAAIVTPTGDMKLREARTERRTTVTVGEDTRQFVESQTWTFAWK